MALGMCIVLVCEAITVAIDSKSSGIAAVFFVFAFEACFTWGESHSVLSSKTAVMHVDTRANEAFHRMDGHGLGLSRRDSPAQDSLQGRRTSSSRRFPWKLLGKLLF